MTKKAQLNSNSISAMKPGCADLADSGENRGLRVSCAAAGAKSFYYRYTSPVTGKLVQMHIGRFPETTLAKARVRLGELKQLRKMGRCPASDQKASKQEGRLASQTIELKSYSVKQMIDFYLEYYIEGRQVDGRVIGGARKEKGQKEVRRTLYSDAVRVLGDRQAVEVTRKDIVKMIIEIVDRGANVQAGNVVRELSAAYEFSIGLEKFDDTFANPALQAKNSLRRAKVRLTSQKGKRVLNDSELVQFLTWLPGSVFTPTQKNILRFTLWTGCRTGEVCDARWADIDLEKRYWHVKTKTETERYVQLPTQAVDFLKQLKLITGDFPFPSQKTGIQIQQKSITEQAWKLRETKRMLDIAHWSPHDLRRTVRTGLSRLGCPSEVGEAILGHSRKGIEGTYDLHKYEAECRVWLQKWADHIDDLIKLAGR
ncbi:site-specific integrase [Cellvibrio sp. KY-YJ-3]|uniref:tyrosine-type recombinase/integrase n=1 Tax=Cellvibrio sp. KY-YJ-3 TaxID=454662 RepID=UPI001246E285|nr:site-specific integrase [Cellvibrio sp. KY-YJ-3]QEY13288.1 site-specific integrase [Cellvibrio sp. KY-YJ-3]